MDRPAKPIQRPAEPIHGEATAGGGRIRPQPPLGEAGPALVAAAELGLIRSLLARSGPWSLNLKV